PRLPGSHREFAESCTAVIDRHPLRVRRPWPHDRGRLGIQSHACEDAAREIHDPGVAAARPRTGHYRGALLVWSERHGRVRARLADRCQTFALAVVPGELPEAG